MGKWMGIQPYQWLIKKHGDENQLTTCENMLRYIESKQIRLGDVNRDFNAILPTQTVFFDGVQY